MPLTSRQQILLRAIRDHWQAAGIGPSISELMRACGIRSMSTMLDELDALQAHGHIRRTPQVARSIVLVETPKPPPMTRGIYSELMEALDELDAAFGGPARMPTAESANARRWVEAHAPHVVER